MVRSQPSGTEPRVVGRLFAEFADGVYTLAFRMLGDRHLAEDVVQETFIKVMRSLDTFRGDGPMAAWLYRIGYREAIAVSRRRREDPVEPAEIALRADRPADDVEHVVVARELAVRLDDAIAGLPEALRSASCSATSRGSRPRKSPRSSTSLLLPSRCAWRGLDRRSESN